MRVQVDAAVKVRAWACMLSSAIVSYSSWRLTMVNIRLLLKRREKFISVHLADVRLPTSLALFQHGNDLEQRTV